MKKPCLYLLPTFISFAGSKRSVIPSFPARQTTQTSDQTFNRLIKSAFEVSCTVFMSSCWESFSRFPFHKSLAGFISRGNQIRTVITGCTSQRLQCRQAACLSVRLQTVDWVSPETSCKQQVRGRKRGTKTEARGRELSKCQSGGVVLTTHYWKFATRNLIFSLLHWQNFYLFG